MIEMNLGTIIEGAVLAALLWNARALHSLDRRLLVLETQLRPMLPVQPQAGE